MIPRFLIAAVLLTPLAGTSCAAILDIEEAELDETLGETGSGGAASGSPCELYCDTVMATCGEVRNALDEITANHAQYDSRATCLGVCSKFPSGSPGDRNGLSVACRQHFATLAATSEPDVHCPIAGPGGNGVCGTNCLSYCAIMLSSCPGAFNNALACATECGRLPDLGEYNITMQAGGEIQCRLYHASVAVNAPDVHCSHANGARPCVQ